MTGGLLACLNDPELMARAEERAQLIRKLAAAWGSDYDSTRAWLDAEDAEAMELFSVGNIVPRGVLH